MEHDTRILLVEDDPHVRHAAAQSLELADLDVSAHATAEAALAELDNGAVDGVAVIVSDVRLPGIDGFALLDRARERDPDLPVILITGHGDVAMAVSAMKGGAYDFIEKPFSSERLREAVARAGAQRGLILENRRLRRELAQRRATGSLPLIGTSAAMEKVRRLVSNVAATDAPVLIVGDTGTGKESVARHLHDLSVRHDKPFVALNCGAVPETVFESELFGYEAGAFTGAAKRRVGKLEYASGGTLFLDEIESMPLALQVKLLRVLQDGVLDRLGSNQSVKIDVRIVAAAKGDMLALVESGVFRRDLLYRLNVVTVAMPTLAERRDDILPLFEYFVADAAIRYQRAAPELGAARRGALLAAPWLGNVRELRNAADRFVLGVDEALDAAAMPIDDGSAPSLKDRVERFEKGAIADALAQCKGSVSAAAERLQLPKATLYEKIKRYALHGRPDSVDEGRASI
ncbi:sigma-54-dependent transcriptional regulator [Chitinasiproducens palmae]|uniref:Two-component system, NtrC family, C4-dicarboxylate transport response regulator DctD n=1 Tax=Chitinasiproducens palmae TaxID=1770053 RepID=A0A1H2PLZ5_9BURK|nr:sigma-54 dependent transcriptional regulator [Chitinasiproducens palmae]SDV47443.1 two-component system, NtrC family, C4-dicarboxylate transport response regulator DctD [Chitinasiproducens palmae]